MRRHLSLFALLVFLVGLCASGALAQQAVPLSDIPGPGTLGGAPESSERLSTAVEIALLLTVLSLLPAVLITITSFTRVVIVLSFVRRALSVNELPPNPVIIGLALFLTMFVMAPLGQRMHAEAWVPYQEGELTVAEAGDVAWTGLSEFLVANTRESELALFAELTELEPLPDGAEYGPNDLPLTVVVPAFVLSELKTAFQMGFLLFLPFLVIDLVVSSVLLSMGMFMLPPVMISTPIKVLIFVLVDGWHLIAESLVTSFVTV
jgi:flagellar biosynthetic protein FliP